MKRSEDVLLQDVAGEAVLVPLGGKVMDLNGLVVLNATGRFVWQELAEQRSVQELAAAVSERFEVSAESACIDVQQFVDHLAELGLLAR